MTRDEGRRLADQHRATFGDDVVLHDPEEYDWGLGCQDCDWLITCADDGWGIEYYPDDEDDLRSIQ